MAARRFLRWWWLGGVLMLSPLLAQDRPTEPPKDGAAQTETKKTPPPDKPAPTPSREFKPSEEVSPDQEVDFPADL